MSLPAPFCKLLVGFGSTNKTAIPYASPHLRLSLCSCYVFLYSVFPPLSGISDRKCPISPPPLLSRYNGSLVTHFFRKISRPMNWPGRVHCSSHSLSNVNFLLLPLISTHFLTRKKGVQSLKNSFDTPVSLSNH